MSHIITYIIMFTRLFLISGTSALMMFILIKAMCGQQRSGWYFVTYWFFRFFVQEIFITVVWANMYQDELWYQIVYGTETTISFIIGTLVYWFVFSGDILKKTLVGLLVDCICGAINTIPVFLISAWEGNFYYVNQSGRFNFHDIFIPVFGMMIFYPLYRSFYPMMLRVRTYELKYRHIWWGVVVGMFTLAFLNNQAASLIWKNNDNTLVLQMVIIMFICIATTGFTMLWVYTRSLREKRTFLCENRDRMERHYDIINRQIQQMEVQQKEITVGLEKINQIQTLMEEKDLYSKSDNSAKTTEWMQNYMNTLKNRYDDLKMTLFCDDYAVDAVLSCFVEFCRKQGIRTDILFQGYQRKKVEEEAVITLLNKILECGVRAVGRCSDGKKEDSQKSWINLHVATVKNQMIFFMEAFCPKPDRIKKNVIKRSLRPWLKKYDGVMDIRLENKKMEIIIGLENE